jgi:hypothetical protein
VAGSIVPLAHLVEVGPRQLIRDGANLGQAPDGGLIAQGQLVRAHAGVLVGQCRNGAIEDQNNIIAELRQLLVLAAAKSFAQPHEHQQRADAPGDAKHGEKAAQLVRHDGAEDLAESV